MSERQTGPYDSIARKWLALAERRQAAFLDMCSSGRWRHYFTPAELDVERRNVFALRDQWAMIVDLPPDAEQPAE